MFTHYLGKRTVFEKLSPIKKDSDLRSIFSVLHGVVITNPSCLFYFERVDINIAEYRADTRCDSILGSIRAAVPEKCPVIYLKNLKYILVV